MQFNFEQLLNAMRKAFFVSLVTLWCAFVYAQPTLSDLTFPNTVDVFGLFEMSFQLGKYDNPYDPDVIDVYAEFTAPDGKSLKVNGFYYEALPREGRILLHPLRRGALNCELKILRCGTLRLLICTRPRLRL